MPRSVRAFLQHGSCCLHFLPHALNFVRLFRFVSRVPYTRPSSNVVSAVLYFNASLNAHAPLLLIPLSAFVIDADLTFFICFGAVYFSCSALPVPRWTLMPHPVRMLLHCRSRYLFCYPWCRFLCSCLASSRCFCSPSRLSVISVVQVFKPLHSKFAPSSPTLLSLKA